MKSCAVWLAVVCLVLASSNGCRQKSKTDDHPENLKAETHFEGDELPTVLFDMKPSSASGASGGLLVYECTYEARGRTARFKFAYKETKSLAGKFPVAMGEGKFIAEAGSQNSALLEDLKKALDAKQIPHNSPRVAELAFDAVTLGEKQSRDSKGGYSSTPPGDWVAMKLFFPKGQDEAEVFLNFNPVLGKGEFSIKDSDYGDYLLREFAKVL